MNFNKIFLSKTIIKSFCFMGLFLLNINANAANVVQRNTIKSVAAPSRVNTAARMPTVVSPLPVVSVITEPVAALESVIESVPEPVITVENKSSKFETAMENSGATGTDSAANARAELIRNQRAALSDSGTTATKSPIAEKNACDTGLRDCMKKICANDFSKCDGDGDTVFGDKLNSCRRDLKCSGTEFELFGTEIKLDRDNFSKMSGYTDTINCGNNYNNCIIQKCGKTMDECIGKSDGDAAIESCSGFAKKCETMDSGLASRTMNVFATLRSAKEVEVAADEKRLYQLRDKMAAQCKSLGAMFDTRTLDCVYTVEFWADGSKAPHSSQKAYAGNAFVCNQNWFGVDITTFKENAYRLTRSQKGASSAALGSGVGIAAGAVASGATGRALDTKKANAAVSSAAK